MVEFRVSDYLEDASDEVIEDIARTTLGKILCDGSGYTDRVTAWLTAPEFSEIHRPTYLERNERAGDREGKHKVLRHPWIGLIIWA